MLSPTLTLTFLFSLIIVWLIVSIAMYFAARIVVGSKARFADALGLVIIGVVIVGLVSFFTRSLLGSFFASILTFIVWIWLVKTFFRTNWLKALGISILSVFMLIVITIILAFLMGVTGFFLFLS